MHRLLKCSKLVHSTWHEIDSSQTVCLSFFILDRYCTNVFLNARISLLLLILFSCLTSRKDHAGFNSLAPLFSWNFVFCTSYKFVIDTHDLVCISCIVENANQRKLEILSNDSVGNYIIFYEIRTIFSYYHACWYDLLANLVLENISSHIYLKIISAYMKGKWFL